MCHDNARDLAAVPPPSTGKGKKATDPNVAVACGRPLCASASFGARTGTEEKEEQEKRSERGHPVQVCLDCM